MTAIQTAFENHCDGKPVDLRKNGTGRYHMAATRAAYSEFKRIYEIGFAAGQCEPRDTKQPMGTALQHLARPARAMGMGYGD